MTNLLTDVATTEPEALTVGDSWTWQRPDLTADYPVASYTLAYQLLGPDGVTRSATASGSNNLVNIAPGTTAGYPAGRWRWAATITAISGGAKLTVATGGFTVAAALSSSTALVPFTTSTHAERVLAAIEATIEGRASRSDEETRLADGRLVKNVPIADLLMLRNQYLAEVRDARNAARLTAGGNVGRRLLTRMG